MRAGICNAAAAALAIALGLGCGSSGDSTGNASEATGATTASTGATSSAMGSTGSTGAGGAGGSTAATSGTGGSTAGTGGGSGHAIKHVFIILLENHDWSQIKGSAQAPYINSLLPTASHAEQYSDSGNHPSEPNYLWLEAGTNFKITNDGDPSVNHQSTKQHLVSLLGTAGKTWKSYQEDISGTDCPLVGVKKYAPRHNPVVFFDDVTDTNDAKSANCITHVRPYSELATDLTKSTVPNYSFITPNLCDDMHDTCDSNQIKQGDDWLKTAVPPIVASSTFKADGALFITWDEGATGDHVGMIVLSPFAKGAGYSNTIHYTHSSTLRTIEEILDASPLLGDAANATDLADLFTTFP